MNILRVSSYKKKRNRKSNPSTNIKMILLFVSQKKDDIRGINTSDKHNNFRRWLSTHHISLVALLETHIKELSCLLFWTPYVQTGPLPQTISLTRMAVSFSSGNSILMSLSSISLDNPWPAVWTLYPLLLSILLLSMLQILLKREMTSGLSFLTFNHLSFSKINHGW